jgi:ketosteroid isomerase-like protein
MRSIAPAFCAALLALAAPAAQEGSAAARDLRQLETVWNRAHVEGDAGALASLWADDLEVAVPKMSVMSKSDALAFANSGRMKFERYETSDIRVRVYGDSAVVTGRLQRTRTMNGQTIADDWQFTKTYVKQAGSWRVVSFHASDAPPAS